MHTARSQHRLSRNISPSFGSLLVVLACLAAGSAADASTTHSYVYGGPGGDEHTAAAPTSSAWTYADASAHGTTTASTDFGLMKATLDFGGGAGNSPSWRAISEFTDYVTVRSSSLAVNTPVQVVVDFVYSGSWNGTNIGCGCGLWSSYGNWNTSISVDQGAVHLSFGDGAFVGGATGSLSNTPSLVLNTWVGATFTINGRLDLSGFTNYSNTLFQDFTSHTYLSSTSDVTFDADSLHSYLPSPDTDGDGVADSEDNCSAVANVSQCDSDADGYGNACDGDLNNNSSTNAQDYVLFRQQLGQPSVAPTYNKADINCSGAVNAQDYVLFHNLLGSPPGPSGLACAGTSPCPAP